MNLRDLKSVVPVSGCDVLSFCRMGCKKALPITLIMQRQRASRLSGRSGDSDGDGRVGGSRTRKTM